MQLPIFNVVLFSEDMVLLLIITVIVLNKKL